MNLLDYFLQFPAVAWAVVGVCFLIVEVLTTSGFFISFATSALVVALLIWIRVLTIDILWAGLVFAVLGAALIPPFRYLIRNKLDQTPDINSY